MKWTEDMDEQNLNAMIEESLMEIGLTIVRTPKYIIISSIIFISSDMWEL